MAKIKAVSQTDSESRSGNPGFPHDDAKRESFIKGLSARLRHCAGLAGNGDALAQKAAVPRRTLETYLAGRAEPKASRLVAIARAVNISLDWLLTGEGPMERGDDAPASNELHRAEDAQFKPFVNLDRDLLSDMVVAVEEALAERGFTLAPDRKGELIATLYEMEAEEGQQHHADQTKRNVTRLLRLVS